MKATDFKKIEQDIKSRFTLRLLKISTGYNPDTAPKPRFASFPNTFIFQKGWDHNQHVSYRYQYRNQSLENQRTRYLATRPRPENGEPSYSRMIIAKFDMHRRYIVLYENHQGDYRNVGDYRILLNIIERQIAELMPDIKVERMPGGCEDNDLAEEGSGNEYD